MLSCSGKNDTPQGIIKPKEMSGIMWDVLRAQNFAAEIARKDSSINVAAQTKVLTQKVFEIHKINASLFDKSYNWYTSHPDMLETIFDSLYTQKERENDLLRSNQYKHVFKDSLIKKMIK
ncbi:MAG: DUF4296 domain-containing protein [Bacteroidota bacterium]|nr:DUF4296 domain-containing protein [Bacteroidota bacterium]MDQ6890003.1 DUF4296 domain-containing protein [Bacteroidota bacterium]